MEEVPFEDRVVPLAEIDWDRSAWWWYPITRVVHPAVRMTSLALSAIGLGVSGLGISLADRVFQPRWNAGEVVEVGNGAFTPQIVTWITSTLQSLFAFSEFGVGEFAYLTFLVLWLSLTFGLVGGVLARRAAVELGQRTIAPWGESLKIVGSRWASFLWASGLHLIGIGALLLPALILGWISRWGTVGATVAGVGLLISFPLVFAVGRFALSAVLCFPLSVCAISLEKKADAFEGFSRSNAYLFQRPVVAVVCSVLLALCGVVGEQLVYWTITCGWGLIRAAVSTGAGSDISGTMRGYMDAGNWLTSTLIAAYWFSFFWAGAAAVYLCLRKSVDHTDLEEIDTIESAVQRTLPEIPTTSQPLEESPGPAVSTDKNPEAAPGEQMPE